jgi:hypothetical protein
MRHSSTKLQRLHALHPTLAEKVYAMFAELWPAREVKRAIEIQYGERLGLRSIERYQRLHWQARREMARQLELPFRASVRCP